MKRIFSVFLFGFSLAAAAAPRARPDFGVVFNDDADLAFVVPDRAKAEEFLRSNVEPQLAACAARTGLAAVNSEALAALRRVLAGDDACETTHAHTQICVAQMR